MIAQVAVSAAVYAIDKPYSYRIPSDMPVEIGMRVTVPFGRSNRRSEAVVLSVSEGDATRLKSVERIMDDQPILSEREIRLAAFLRQRYFCTFYEAIRAILPAGVWLSSSLYYELTEKKFDREQFEQKEPFAYQVYRNLVDLGGSMELSALKKIYADQTEFLEAALQILIDRGIIRSNLDISKGKRDKTEKIVSLAVSAEEAMKFALRKKKAAPLQYEVLQLLISIGSGNSKEICYYTGASMATLKRMEELGYVRFTVSEVFRTPLPACVPHAQELVLNEEQDVAFHGLRSQMMREAPGAALLYGVTGSGKTAVYIRLIQDVLERGKSAVLLVPEISLTPQLLSLLMSYFGELVAVLHSGLRVTERYDEWKRIRNGSARVVVGTRSAVFAPVSDLGLIILDEEQEHTYKSENTPRYHAREVAMYRGVKEDALVLLGSATPSVETMYRAKNGQYVLYCLRNRFNGSKLPHCELVDLRQELQQGNPTSISLPLKQAMEEAFADQKQCILFLNRRGAGKYRICVSCGSVPTCPRCSVNLTYHLANQRLMCHHCGYSETSESVCAQCGGHMKTMGTGTQKVEQELQKLFPDRDVLRMDADTISARTNHEVLLHKFENEHIPILLGTQMITKGLNFDDVTVVGVLDADQALYSGNYRAAETAFSMVTQVVGRSGRGASAGRAYVQTMAPEHSVLQLASLQDYDQFYELEITMRQMLKNPPFSDIFQISIVGPYDDKTFAAASRFRHSLDAALKQPEFSATEGRVLGPAAAPILKINNTYRYRVTLSCVNQNAVRLLLAHLLHTFSQDKQNRGISAFVDVNPYE